jgi:hypothetical protein
MNHTSRPKHANLFIGAAVIIVVLGVLSAIGAPSRTYTGFGMDGMHRVNMVEAGSPAARAGIQVGDILRSLNGVLIAEAPFSTGTAHWHDLTFDRGGQAVSLVIAPAPLTARRLYLSLVATLFGLCFVGFPLWAYLAAPGRPATLLALFGLTFGATILGTPTVPPGTASFLLFELMWTFAFLGTAAFLHVLLAFPPPAGFLTRPWSTKILYAPVVAVVLTQGLVIALHVRFQAQALGDSMILFFGVYFLATIVGLVWRYATARAAMRTTHGLGLILVSTAIVVALFIAYPVVTSFWPAIATLPGWPPWESYYLGAAAIIPIAYSIAAVRNGRAHA